MRYEKILNFKFSFKIKTPQLACDNVEHCHDGGDETNCEMIHLKENYDSATPPFGYILENGVKVAEPVVIEAEVTILELLHIDDTKATFTVFFR